MRKTIAEYAKEYMEIKGFDAVGYSDSSLLHEIAECTGMKHNAWRTEKNVLAALDRSKLFTKGYFLAGYRQQKPCRIYKLKNTQG